MKSLKPRSDLPKKTQDELADLMLNLGAPAVILKLIGGILTHQEKREIGTLGVVEKAPPKDWVSARQIIDVVARRRQLTLERALIELARSLELIVIGRYEQLRRAIGEPVVPERNDVPQWDGAGGELRYKGRIVRRLSAKADKPRLILDAFQADGWPARIDIPFAESAKSTTKREAVRSLNNEMLLIKFFCDGTGEGIAWQEVT